jgi:hypothetical protein
MGVVAIGGVAVGGVALGGVSLALIALGELRGAGEQLARWRLVKRLLVQWLSVNTRMLVKEWRTGRWRLADGRKRSCGHEFGFYRSFDTRTVEARN